MLLADRSRFASSQQLMRYRTLYIVCCLHFGGKGFLRIEFELILLVAEPFGTLGCSSVENCTAVQSSIAVPIVGFTVVMLLRWETLFRDTAKGAIQWPGSSLVYLVKLHG